MSDGNTKVLQNPNSRLDQQKATLKIGDRVPIAPVRSPQRRVSGGVSVLLVNNSFQYLDVA